MKRSLERVERIKIRLRTGEVRSVAATVVGDFAVARSGASPWYVVHMPSGFSIVRGFADEADAVKAAEAIQHLRNDWIVYAPAPGSGNLYRAVGRIAERFGGEPALQPTNPVEAAELMRHYSPDLNGYAD